MAGQMVRPKFIAAGGQGVDTEAWLTRFRQALACLLPTASNCRARPGGAFQPALDFDG